MESSNKPADPAAPKASDTGIKDFLPIPATNPGVNEGVDGTSNNTSGKLEHGQTFSHNLATAGHDGETERGHAQRGHHHEEDVVDLGWNEKKEEIAAPLVGGMDNDELWMLVRRFNKQIYHLKAVPYPVPGGLDLNVADDEEFSPDKMRANIERLYMTVGVGMLAAIKHVARLRSWRERRRTAAFAAVYFIAWLLDLLVPLFSAVVIALIASPEARQFLFPPAPVSLVDSRTGGVQKPKSGVLGSHDSATGAPENHKGEAVEQEASNFVNSIASIALSSAAGKHPQGDPDSAESSAAEAAPDPTAVASRAAEAKDVATGSKPGAKHDKTKVPMETALWNKMRPIMHTLGVVADTWERFANALSPTPPFPKEVFRLRLISIIIPLVFGVSLFVTPYAFLKSVSFINGILFFGDPLLTRALDWLNRMIPNWKKLLELRNTILKGVPTNAQLTITLLRLGEANNAPLPPPPRIDSPPPSRPASLDESQLRATGSEPPLNATRAELDAAIAHDPTTAGKTEPDVDAAKSAKHGKAGNKILGFFRGATRNMVRTTIGSDTVRAKIGSHHARDRLGVVPPKDKVPISGPVAFEARYNGKRGHVYLSKGATVPVVGFGVGSSPQDEDEVRHPIWSVPVASICEVKKIGGYGWKAKLVVGWSMQREVNDGLELRTDDGQVYKITAVPLRDELFNRLVAMGGQVWEAW